ncbi:MAG: MFS transporter [Chloroflexi bacterium]|nr:MFS transporter [Chloroflexota bacterium]
MGTVATPEKKPHMLARTFASMTLYRNYRLLWLGSWTEHMGEWMETTALLWLLNQMTNSPVMGTLMVTLRHLPMVLFASAGGITADRFDRRRVLVFALAISAASSIAIAALVHVGHIEPWHILAYSALAGVLTGFNHPARHSMLPNMVKREHLLNAITLDNASVTVSRIVGAPLSGLIIGLAGTTPVLGVKALGGVLAIGWLSRIHVPATSLGAKKKTAFSNFKDGMRYVGEHRPVLTQILLYLLPYFLTNTYTGLLPYFATNNLHIGPDLYGILNAGPGAGSLAATFILASLVNFRRKGLLLLIGGIAQGVGLIFFASSTTFALSLVLLVFVGGANTTFLTLNNTVIQEMISDEVRGRVMSLRETFNGLGPAGSMVSGSIAAAAGAPLALVFAGGVSVVILLGILVGVPQTRQRS